MPENQIALSIGDAARAAGIGRTHLYHLIKHGQGPRTVTLGRRRVIRVAALDEWLASRERQAAGDGGDYD